MSKSLADILGGRTYDEPEEARIIKLFIRKHFKTEVPVNVQATSIIIAAPSSAFAGALRPHLYDLAMECKTKKRLVIRVVK